MLKKTLTSSDSIENSNQIKFKLIAENAIVEKTNQPLKSLASISANFIERHSQLIN